MRRLLNTKTPLKKLSTEKRSDNLILWLDNVLSRWKDWWAMMSRIRWSMD